MCVCNEAYHITSSILHSSYGLKNVLECAMCCCVCVCLLSYIGKICAYIYIECPCACGCFLFLLPFASYVFECIKFVCLRVFAHRF